MVLAVNIGNSHILLGCFQEEKIWFLDRISTKRDATALDYIVLIKTVLELNRFAPSQFRGGIISSVVPSVTPTVKEAMTRLLNKPVMVVGPGIKNGLKIMLDNPAQLGSDRVVNAVAAVNHYPCPGIVIDLGTATALSVIDQEKCLIGGMILPGVKLSLDALTSQASQLPQISLTPPKKLIASNTADCLKSGMIYGTAAAIDGVVCKIEEELGRPCTLIATGEFAGDVIPFCSRTDIIIDDRLLLKGLMIIYDKNQIQYN